VIADPILCKRELECLKLFWDGLNRKEIASVLRVSKKSVECYLLRAHHKVGARSDAMLAKWALERGLLTTQEPKCPEPFFPR